MYNESLPDVIIVRRLINCLLVANVCSVIGQTIEVRLYFVLDSPTKQGLWSQI